MIRLEIFDFDFERLGNIENYTSVSYTVKFQDVGSFQLSCILSEQNNELLQKNRFVWIEDDICGIIQYIEKNRSYNDTTIVAKGKLVCEILNWRWVYPCFTKTGSPNVIMEQIVNAHCVNPTDSKRKFNNFVIGTKGEISSMESITYQKTGDSVLDSEKNLATANNLGFAVVFNPRIGNKLKFVVYQGTDRTIGNSEGNDEVFFTQSLNNILNAKYIYNDDAFRNVELVAGEAEDGSDNENTKRTTLEVFLDEHSKSVSSYNRLEKFVDARDLQSEYYEDEITTDESGNTITESIEKVMTAEQYEESLRQRGNEEFKESTLEESYSGSVRTDEKTVFRYKQDYNVGDKVTIIDQEFGISIDTVITEMKVTYDKDLYTYEPTFGVAIPTILDKIKRAKRR